ncbi:TetR/AcrR family transcriptional regulator [Nioella nitratireducens]|uniref:TetR/AcrR family transcriptional regulator n=1 Tax=Nioella nitratireducens TaxID=1287720 RepID=UPI0008FD43AD|nr:TetR family transcriptional regulator [Nioella nitratireducens]
MSRRADPIAPRKTPRQARAQATYAAVLQAAAHILTEQGRGALTTNRIAERAGVSIGSLYQYFPSKEAILADLLRGMRREMLADIEAAAAACGGLNLRALTEALIRASVRHHAQAPDLARVLEQVELELPGDPETARIEAQLRDLLAAALADRGVPGPTVAAQDLAAITKGITDEAARAGETDLDFVIARAVRAVHGYLGL